MKKAACLLVFLFLVSVFGYSENFLFMNSGVESIQYVEVAKSSSEKKQKKTKEKKPKNEVVVEDDAPVTKINIDKTKKKNNTGFFSRIDSEILSLVEDGSPESLTEAFSKLKKSSMDYEENEKVLVFIISEIMSVVWPSQNARLEYPHAELRNAYIGAIESARNGVYDTSTGNTDFLATVLPSLVLCGTNSHPEYADMAESDLKAALSMNPNSVLANYLLGLLYSKTGKNREAVALLRSISEKSAAFEISFCLASALNSLGRYEESQNVTDKLIVMYPSNLSLLRLLAQNSYERADYSSAERYAMLVLTQNPADLEMVLFRAKVFVKTGEYLKAASLLDVYAKSNSTAREYLLLRARVQKEWNKNLSAAISTMERALSLYQKDSEVVLYAAELAGESGRTVGGRTGAQLSEQILGSDPENPAALSFLISTLVNEGQWSQAYASSKKLLAKNSSSKNISTHVKICLALNLNDEAWTYASSLYEKSPTEERALQTYVEAMVRTGRTSQASRFITSLLGSSSNSMKSFLYYQRSFLASGEAAQLSDLRSSVIANPRNSDALFRMYTIYFQKQDYRKAQYYLRQVIALNPNNGNYLRLNADLDKLIK